jgi:branched-chain amino acid transport system ATP-binding protein
VQARLGVRAVSAFKRLDGQSREPALALLAQTGLEGTGGQDA